MHIQWKIAEGRKLIFRPSCGLDVQNPTHSLKSVKDPGNTFELNPKWERTLPSFDNFYGIFIALPKIEITKLIFDTLLRAWGAESHPGTSAKFFYTWVYNKGIVRIFKWLKCFGGILHLKPTAGCQISTLLFEFFLWKAGLYKYSMNNISRTAKFLSTANYNITTYIRAI
jgi:hypothetical protein